MAKKGMKRPEITDHKQNSTIVPEIQGKAKTGQIKANPIIAGTQGASLKVYHQRPISYRVLDNDLARDNLENDIPFADLQDL